MSDKIKSSNRSNDSKDSNGSKASNSSNESNESNGSIIVKKPNNHPFDINNVSLWLDKSDPSIRKIATEFILKTVYINHSKFLKTYKVAIKEMLDILKTNVLQFFINVDDINKSSYWIMQIIKKYINKKKYTIKIINDVKKLDESFPVIIADDASYSGSQISNTIGENFQNTKYNIFILIPFISNTSIDIIKRTYTDNLNEGSIMFLDRSIYIMKPIYELMSKDKIEKLFLYYSNNPKYIREYPIYFDHKVADNYSSFPLIYTYGIIPNNYNKELIHGYRSKGKLFKDIYEKLERIPLLKNCKKDIPYDIHIPQCPLQPYKANFTKLSRSVRRAKSYTYGKKSLYKKPIILR